MTATATLEFSADNPVTIDWGDGSSERHAAAPDGATVTHTYPGRGVFRVAIQDIATFLKSSAPFECENWSTTANQGAPGYFTPAGSVPPRTFADMPRLAASPTSAWSNLTWATIGDGTNVMWDGNAWRRYPSDAYAGTPGRWGPADAVMPGDRTTVDRLHITAHPSTLWPTGSYVELRPSWNVWWTGETWLDGVSPQLATSGNQGTPGSWLPAGSRGPVDFAELQKIPPSPTTLWSAAGWIRSWDPAGFNLGAYGFYWDGTAWLQIGAEAVAGDPGHWLPSGAGLAPNNSNMNTLSIKANPTTRWTVGQHVLTRQGTAWWTGTVWNPGVAT